MASPARIRTQRHVTAMAALDTVELLAERATNLLSHNRRITMTQRYTWVEQPPEVKTGLHVEGEPHLWRQDDGIGFGVRLGPDLLAGFGFAAYAYEGNATEAEAWKRFHAAKAESDRFSERRRNMTEVTICGGMPGDSPARDDLIVVRAWNDDGVCDERVIAFDTTLLWDQRVAAEAVVE